MTHAEITTGHCGDTSNYIDIFFPEPVAYKYQVFRQHDMTATINFDVKFSNSHALDSVPCTIANGFISSKLFDMPRCGVRAKTQIAHPCPGIFKLASGGAMPRYAHYYKRYRTNQSNRFHKPASPISIYVQCFPISLVQFNFRFFITKLLLS